ncbi:MAG: hypothetical protein R2731_06055 [Nocardioides sp.]
MTRTVLAKTLWESRRSVLGWTLAIAGVGATYAAFWPSIDTPRCSRRWPATPRRCSRR